LLLLLLVLLLLLLLRYVIEFKVLFAYPSKGDKKSIVI